MSRQGLILSTAFLSCIDRDFNSRQNFFTCPSATGRYYASHVTAALPWAFVSDGGFDSVTAEPLAPVYLLNRIVRHVGDEVAAVAADSEEIAEEALRLIEIEYRTLSFVLDAESALASDAPPIRGGSNLAGREPIILIRGDVDRGMAEADLIIEETYRTQSTSPLPLEPRYSLAWWL